MLEKESPTVSPNDMKLWLLGTGTPVPSLKRASSGYLLKVDGSYIVFDHGFGAYHRLLELNIPLTEISHVFITHYHFDHMGDLARLILTRWDQGAGNIPELKIYGPKPLKRIIDSMLSDNGLFGIDLRARTESESSMYVYHSRGGEGSRDRPNPEIKELQEGDQVNSNAWNLHVTEGIHQQPYITPLAYRLDYKNQSFVYSGDSSPSKKIQQLSENCDVLVHMCHYISGSSHLTDDVMGHIELAHLAQKANVKNLVLTHMAESIFDKPGIKEKIIIDIGEIYKGNIFFGEDLLEIPFNNSEL